MAKMTEARYKSIVAKTKKRKDLTLWERKAIIDKAFKEYSKDWYTPLKKTKKLKKALYG